MNYYFVKSKTLFYDYNALHMYCKIESYFRRLSWPQHCFILKKLKLSKLKQQNSSTQSISVIKLICGSGWVERQTWSPSETGLPGIAVPPIATVASRPDVRFKTKDFGLISDGVNGALYLLWRLGQCT